MNPKEILSEYGDVVTCKVIQDQVVTIVLTEGFTGKGTKTFRFLNKCEELFPNFHNIETCITREGLAVVVLTRLKEKNIDQEFRTVINAGNAKIIANRKPLT